MSQAQQPHFDVAVIGGGVAGLSVAWSALRRGLHTVVLERGEPGGGASHAAAGMLAPTSEAAYGEENLLALALASAERYESWCAELAEASGIDPELRRCGSLHVARDRDEAEALERELAFRRDLGLPVERLLPSQARRREPALAPALRLAVEAPGDHAIDPRRLARVLVTAIEGRGGEVRVGANVARLTTGDERVTGVELRGGERIRAARVVVAAGAWSARGLELPPGAGVPVRPVKGQIMRLRDPAGPGLLTRVLRLANAYVVPRGDGRYVLGATVEERGWDVSATAGGVFELLRSAREVLPGVDEWVIEEITAGLRPGTPDNAPVLGGGNVAGLFWAAGHFRNGILLAPVTGEILASALAGDPVSPLTQPFTPARFTPAAVPA